MRAAEQAGTASPADIALGRRCDGEAIARDPALVEPRLREAQERFEALAMRAKGADATICADRAACLDQIREHARAIEAAAPDSAWSPILRARVLLAEGKPEDAVKLLEAGCDHVIERVYCLQERVTAAVDVKSSDAIDAASKDLLGAACVSPVQCADIATWIAAVRTSRGDARAALASSPRRPRRAGQRAALAAAGRSGERGRGASSRRWRRSSAWRGATAAPTRS